MDNGRVRFWQGFCLALAIALAVVVGNTWVTVRAQAVQKPRFAEIDVERINVVEADGTIKLVIANRGRAPDQVTDGVSRPRAQNNSAAGITFFDDAGDEAGGLKVRGDRRTGPLAERHLLFDQHRGDQVVGLVSDENASGRTAGVRVWDRPDIPLPDVIQRYTHLLSLPPGPERSRLESEFTACCEGFGAERVFMGKNAQREAILGLKDARGHERLRLIVSAQGQARIEFLDEQGRPTQTIPQGR